MSDDVVASQKDTAVIAGDAALIGAIIVFVGPLAALLGPAAAWWLHGRRFDRSAVLGGLIGLVLAGVAVGAVFMALVTIGEFIGPIGGSEVAFGIMLLVVASVLFLAALIALDVDALRDFARSRRSHLRVDAARLVATALVVTSAVVITVLQTNSPGSQYGDAGVFALMAGANAALTVWFGNLIREHLERSFGQSGAVSGT
jgi:hypothetical protein